MLKNTNLTLPTPLDVDHWRLSRDVCQFAQEYLHFRPDPAQAQLLNAHPSRVLLNCTRQWGKSTVTAAKAIHQAIFHPNTLTIVVSPSARQSAEFLRKTAQFLMNLEIKPRGDGQNGISLLLPNQSRIVGLPGNEATIRGFSNVSLLIIDEASRVPDELYHAVSPMIAVSGGALWLLSTPNGRQGFFHDAWTRGGNEWHRITVTAAQCPRIKPAHLAQQRRDMSDRMFRQEYECEFLDTEDQLIPHEHILRSLDPRIVPLHLNSFAPAPRYNIPPAPPLTGLPDIHEYTRYFIGVDFGQVHDYTAIAILERSRFITGEPNRVDFSRQRVVRNSIRYLERLPLGTPYTQVADKLRQLARHPTIAENCVIIADATGVGKAVIDIVRHPSPGCTVYPVTITGGDRTNSDGCHYHVPKRDLLMPLVVGFENNDYAISSHLAEAQTLANELTSLRVKVNPSGHESIAPWRDGQHDDLVFATALAIWRTQIEK